MMLKNPFPIFYNRLDAYELGVHDMMPKYINGIASYYYQKPLPHIPVELAHYIGSFCKRGDLTGMAKTYTKATNPKT